MRASRKRENENNIIFHDKINSRCNKTELNLSNFENPKNRKKNVRKKNQKSLKMKKNLISQFLIQQIKVKKK